ncbi:MAG TPA: N-6 DNA methylase [Chloroflexi bacterium]|nr:N-6 DNA methylase [Chloroflexota bacterium]
MPPLPTDLRSQLESTVIAARTVAEEAAAAALTTLAVSRDDPFPAMNEEQRRLRRALRARARQLGAGVLADGMDALRHEIAYAQWHRMLFARFLADNHLLMHPDGVAVTLDDCRELAAEEGAADGWELAARYASLMLPGLFTAADPTVQVRLAPEHRHALEQLLQNLPTHVFIADDSLGWVYQFWQSKQKKLVNQRGDKIDAASLGPVTQLFTEDYMVQFLLHNTLGAWWAAHHPESALVKTFTYLRREDSREIGDWRLEIGAESPISNLYSPISTLQSPISNLTLLDPFGGSGHFMVAAFELLVPMRMEEEWLDAERAVRAVIRDNLFLLDIDPRCCQMATFNLLLAAWKRIGYRRDLPVPNVACSGIAVQGQLADWLKLANGDARLSAALTRLYDLCVQAPTLGSLIDPAAAPLQQRLFSADFAEVAPLLARALAKERGDDPAAALVGESAAGALRALQLLARTYTLVATNVPYLARGKQDETLRSHADAHYPASKHDLATMALERCLAFCAPGGTTALVLPQNWLFLTSYRALREKLLRQETWHWVARLGPGAFATISGEVVKAILTVITHSAPPDGHSMAGIDASAAPTPEAKAAQLRTGEVKRVAQSAQLANPDARVALEESTNDELLEKYACAHEGLTTGDIERFVRKFWEAPANPDWVNYIQNADDTIFYGGRTDVIFWRENGIELASFAGSAIKGRNAWGKPGLRVTQMRHLPITLYTGEIFGKNAATLTPYHLDHLLAIWCFCSSPEYGEYVRQIDQSLKVTTATLTKVPFDLDYWTQVAAERYPDGLPPPFSNDPTQWLFGGHPVGASDPLQVAVARLLGYRWPQHADDDLDAFADADGIVCLAPVAGEAPAHERLRSLLAHAYRHPPTLPDFERYRVGDFVPTTPVPVDAGWSLATQQALLAAAGYGGQTLEVWLRDGFFEQHCRRFHNRPFVWHIWDGRKDGFAALVNYHKLDAAGLQKLTYTYLGAWIAAQRAAVQRGEAGADGRLVAALELQQKLALIEEGEPPYDIYVRWKSVAEQPLGWNPDLNDGVRLNIRPFVEAGVLRKKFTIHWKPDRGKNADGSERVNDRHLSRAEKVAARAG